MARVRVFGLNRIRRKIKLLAMINDPELFDRIGRRSVNYVRANVRKGYTTAKGEKKEPIKPLKRSTIRQRKRLSGFNRFSKFFSPSTSNLHLSGQLIRSLKHSVQGKKVFLEVSGRRKPIKTGPKSKEKNPPSNGELAKYLADQGRPFMGLDGEGKQMIREMVARHVAKKIRQLNLKSKSK